MKYRKHKNTDTWHWCQKCEDVNRPSCGSERMEE